MVPVDYRLSDKQLMETLANLNGLYIPGDTKDTFDDDQFVSSVKFALDWV